MHEQAVPLSKQDRVFKELQIDEMSIPTPLKETLKQIISKNLDAFAETDDDLGLTELQSHTINTGNNPPFREKLRGLPYSRKPFVDRQLERLEKAGVISPATPGECPYASAIVVVKKKEPDPTKQEMHSDCVLITGA